MNTKKLLSYDNMITSINLILYSGTALLPLLPLPLPLPLLLPPPPPITQGKFFA